jgi:hypothetical protein
MHYNTSPRSTHPSALPGGCSIYVPKPIQQSQSPLNSFLESHSMSSMPIDAFLDLSQDHLSLIWFSPGKHLTLRETCMWCLSDCGHSSGIQVKVYIGGDIKNLHVTWECTSDDLERIGRSHPLDNVIEFGAEAIAIVAIREFTPYSAFTRAAKGTGFDYYLSEKRDPNQLVPKNSARLEISGILHESDSSRVSARLRSKHRQTTKSDSMAIPAYVVVVEFSVPQAHMELRHV